MAELTPAQRQALIRLHKLHNGVWSGRDGFFNANAANALAAKGLVVRHVDGSRILYSITTAGHDYAEQKWPKR